MYNTEVSFSQNSEVFKTPENLFEISLVSKPVPKVHSIYFLAAKSAENHAFPFAIQNTPLFKGEIGDISVQEDATYLGLGTFKKSLLHDIGALFLKTFYTLKISKMQDFQIILDVCLLEKFSVKDVVHQCIVALEVALYSTGLLKTKDKKSVKITKILKQKKVLFVVSATNQSDLIETDIKKWSITSKNLNGMRLLQSLPSNYGTPKNIEEYMRVLTKRHKIKMKSFGISDLEKIKAFGILSVAKGSVEEPRMLQLEYIPKGVPSNKKIPTLVLVGKGVTFDTGGISIKPSSEMHEMKYDMSGAAAVLHSIVAIAELNIPVKVIGLVGLAENMPSGTALKPGDVYTSMKGLTVEVQNTDAEGRLILADLLYYGEKFKPDLMVNLATLTGAAVIALGNYYAGLFSRHETCIKLLQKASEISLEPVWNLPLGGLYERMLSSDIADYNNIGGREAGSSTAATFLSFFVDEKTPWVHLDIAGMAYAKKGFGVYPTVARGYGVRLLTELACLLGKNENTKGT